MAAAEQSTFYGWRVVAAAFVLAVFGWGLGFYGPPIYLHAVEEARGWPLALVSSAVTLHFLVGAIFTANLPHLYGRFGVPAVTKAGAVALAGGVAGWAVAQEPWQLFVATFFSGAGWIAMSAAAINAIIAPWFVRARPAALSMAYNGASVGGVVFSPLWVAAITWLGFPTAAVAIGAITAVTVWLLAATVFAKTPLGMGLTPDGDTPGAKIAAPARATKPLPGKLLWRDAGFLTLAAGMALGLFAQIGLLAHLFSLLVPALGAQAAGLAMGGATAAAIAGRTLVGWLMPASADRRLRRGRELRRADRRRPRAALRGRRTDRALAARGVPVRRRHRQRDVAAAPHRPGRVRQGGCAAGRRAHHRDCAGDLCLRAGRVRLHPGVDRGDRRRGTLGVRLRGTHPGDGNRDFPCAAPAARAPSVLTSAGSPLPKKAARQNLAAQRTVIRTQQVGTSKTDC